MTGENFPFITTGNGAARRLVREYLSARTLSLFDFLIRFLIRTGCRTV
jgi:hypothetical protein